MNRKLNCDESGLAFGNQNNPSKDPLPAITFNRHALTLNQLWLQGKKYKHGKNCETGLTGQRKASLKGRLGWFALVLIGFGWFWLVLVP